MPDQSSAERRPWTCALGVCLALVTGCATGGRPGCAPANAPKTAKNYDLAVVEYTKALRANPDDDNARLALERAKLRASQEHAFRARTLAGAERYEEALGEYQLASELNPSDALVDEALRDVRQKLRTKIAVTRNGKTELESLIERSRAPAAARARPAGRRQASRLARLQLGQQPQRVPIDRAVCRAERRLRSGAFATRSSTPTSAR